MSAYFITAVGTGIGKTFTTCALLHAAKKQNIQAAGYKPIISGWVESPETDTALIAAENGIQQSIQSISPWRFEAPLSPHMAAAKEGRTISVEELIVWTRKQAEKQELLLFETVGGVMVPIDNSYTTLDWMQVVNLPAILVTGSYLGSISHTLTALAVMKVVGIEVKALVVNESANGVPFDEAIEGLKPFIQNIPLQIFQPRVSSYHEASEIHTLVTQL